MYNCTVIDAVYDKKYSWDKHDNRSSFYAQLNRSKMHIHFNILHSLQIEKFIISVNESSTQMYNYFRIDILEVKSVSI